MNPNMEALANESIDYLRTMVSPDAKIDAAKLKIARIASSSLNAYISLLRHKNAEERTALRFAQLLYNGNSDQLAEYMRVALPSAGFVTAVEAVKKAVPETERVVA